MSRDAAVHLEVATRRANERAETIEMMLPTQVLIEAERAWLEFAATAKTVPDGPISAVELTTLSGFLNHTISSTATGMQSSFILRQRSAEEPVFSATSSQSVSQQ